MPVLSRRGPAAPALATILACTGLIACGREDGSGPADVLLSARSAPATSKGAGPAEIGATPVQPRVPIPVTPGSAPGAAPRTPVVAFGWVRERSGWLPRMPGRGRCRYELDGRYAYDPARYPLTSYVWTVHPDSGAKPEVLSGARVRVETDCRTPAQVSLTVATVAGRTATQRVRWAPGEGSFRRVNQRPSARLAVLGDPTPRTVILTSFDSKDPDGAVVDHLWDLGDGTVLRHPHVWHTYRAPGRYRVRHIVRDNVGARAASEEWVRVH